MRILGDRGNASRRAGNELYAAAVAAARQPGLYVEYAVPDTLDGRFEMVAMHLFALTHRLMHDPGDDPDLARLVTETFVTDMDGTFREMGVGDVSVPKRMKSLYSSFAGRLTAYGAAIKEGEEALTGAVARNVFPDQPQDQRARDLASYLATAVGAVRATPLSDLREGRVAFPPPLAQRAEAHQ